MHHQGNMDMVPPNNESHMAAIQEDSRGGGEKNTRSGLMVRSRHSLLSEFFREQVPIAAGVFALGILFSILQAGYIPGGQKAFPVAGVSVPIWHLLFMGFWTGYLMGLVGEAGGILSLPYSISVPHFSHVSVTPISLIMTFLNPFGALLGHWRTRQWNLDLAQWLCIGAVLGSPIGPFIRVYLIPDPKPFKALLGVALMIMSRHLFFQITGKYFHRTARKRGLTREFECGAGENPAAAIARSGLPEGFRIVTLEKNLRRITIEYWGVTQTLNVPMMCVVGFLVAVIASAVGVGGGFILVPVMATCFRLPMYVLVAASIPFVITLSLVGVLSYALILPFIAGKLVYPDLGFVFLLLPAPFWEHGWRPRHRSSFRNTT